RGAEREALAAYRSLDVRFPGSVAGREARRRLVTRDVGLTVNQRVERAERLVRHGPLDDARTELAALEALTLPAALASRVHSLMGRMARHEGRWEDAERHLAQARVGADPEDAEADAERHADMAAAARSREIADAEAELRRLGYREALAQRKRVPTPRLFAQLRVSSRASLATQTDALVTELIERPLPPGLRLDAALTSVGVADDALIAQLLEGVEERAGTMGTQGLYHRARALERLGRLAEAEAAFLQVRSRDRGWYGLWSEQRLDAVHAAMLEVPATDDVVATGPVAPMVSMVGGGPYLRAMPVEGDESAKPEDGSTRLEGVVDASLLPPMPAERELDFDALAERLAPIVDAHGEAFPWLGRAEDLLRLGDHESAGRQLYEAFLAWREATGRAIRRTGLTSVARGAERPRSFVPFATKAARRRLDEGSRRELVAIGEAIGDYGVSTGFGGFAAVEALPRAYARKVEEAARRHGLDPNLLFAVMRVESVYQKEIVSYAGAIGLCQIMPRTGALIASAKGDADYTTAWLLDPDVNLDYAGWYLRSLIERFDGHLPLAIASYNGGPHNVRRWLRDRPAGMPMEAFLEHIPFDQTHRYVRRVLGYYAAYRAQQGLPMIELSTELPQPDADRVGF
ncbi:MAG: transglycosylase SLT domain-containing protein, partial [Sandaracinus sp.]|nr:transglycosylase SLT domain-containing protein [Sandaracinus sp.]